MGPSTFDMEKQTTHTQVVDIYRACVFNSTRCFDHLVPRQSTRLYLGFKRRGVCTCAGLYWRVSKRKCVYSFFHVGGRKEVGKKRGLGHHHRVLLLGTHVYALAAVLNRETLPRPLLKLFPPLSTWLTKLTQLWGGRTRPDIVWWRWTSYVCVCAFFIKVPTIL